MPAKRDPARDICQKCAKPHRAMDHRHSIDENGNFHSECLVAGCDCQRFERRKIAESTVTNEEDMFPNE